MSFDLAALSEENINSLYVSGDNMLGILDTVIDKDDYTSAIKEYKSYNRYRLLMDMLRSGNIDCRIFPFHRSCRGAMAVAE